MTAADEEAAGGRGSAAYPDFAIIFLPRPSRHLALYNRAVVAVCFQTIAGRSHRRLVAAASSSAVVCGAHSEIV